MKVFKPADRIQILVADQGAGFSPTRGRSQGGVTGGFGLFSIRERLDWLGGGVEIQSEVGKGSRITLVAPAVASVTAERHRRELDHQPGGITDVPEPAP